MFNKRKKWLKKELKRINKIIDTFPFRYEVTAEGKTMIREGIRTQYDKIKEMVDAANVRIGEEKIKEKSDYEIIKKMTEMAAKYQVDLKQLEEQMAELDKEIDETEMTMNSRIEAARSYRLLILKLLKKNEPKT